MGNKGKEPGHHATQVSGFANREVLFRGTQIPRGAVGLVVGARQELYFKQVKGEFWERHSDAADEEASLRTPVDISI